MAKKSPKPREAERDITGKLLSDIGFEAAHPNTDIQVKNLDPANRAMWNAAAAAIAEAVRRKDAGISQRKAA